MLIFCFDVNVAFREKLVPITRRISTSIEPAGEVIVRKRVGSSPENGELWALETENFVSPTAFVV